MQGGHSVSKRMKYFLKGEAAIWQAGDEGETLLIEGAIGVFMLYMLENETNSFC